MGTLLLALLYSRLMASVADGIGIRGLTQVTTLMILGFVVVFLLRQPSWPRHISLWLAGWTMMLMAGAVSMGMNNVLSSSDAWQFQIQICLYVFFLPVLISLLHSYPTLMMRGLYTFLRWFLILGFILALYQIGTGHLFKGERIYGLAAHPVSYGLQVVVALTLLELIRLRLGRRLPWATIILALISLYLTKSRTAWLLMSLILMFYGGAYFKFGLRNTFYILLATLFTGVALWSGRFSDLSSVPAFLTNTDFESQSYDYRYIDNSFSWRIWSWVQSSRDVLERPLFGYGPGQTTEVSDFGLAMHNILLEILVQVGFVGFLGFVLMLLGHIPMLQRLQRKTPARKLVGAFLLFFFFAATFGASMIYQTMTILLYLMILGVICTLSPPPPS